MLKTVEQMSKISGIGENKLRELMENRELEYVQNGNRRLIADEAIWNGTSRQRRLLLLCPGNEVSSDVGCFTEGEEQAGWQR